MKSSIASLLLCLAAATAHGEDAAPTPLLGGSAEADLVCAAMPGEPAGHFVCEDPDSFAKCQEIAAAKGKVRIEGEEGEVAVLMCVQGG